MRSLARAGTARGSPTGWMWRSRHRCIRGSAPARSGASGPPPPAAERPPGRGKQPSAVPGEHDPPPGHDEARAPAPQQTPGLISPDLHQNSPGTLTVLPRQQNSPPPPGRRAVQRLPGGTASTVRHRLSLTGRIPGSSRTPHGDRTRASALKGRRAATTSSGAFGGCGARRGGEPSVAALDPPGCSLAAPPRATRSQPPPTLPATGHCV